MGQGPSFMMLNNDLKSGIIANLDMLKIELHRNTETSLSRALFIN